MKTIASVYYLDLTTYRPYTPIGGKGSNYKIHIPACPRGEVRTIQIPDFVERSYVLDDRFVSSTDATSAVLVADDVVHFWQDAGWPDAPAGSGPGICVCKGDKPTDEEIAAITRRQEVYCEYLINMAQNKWVSGQRDKILEEERQAARWMGKEDFDWIKPMRAVTMVACPGCGTQIQAGVMKCASCGTIVDFAKYGEYAKLQRQFEAAAMAGTPPPVAPVPVAVELPSYDGKALDLTSEAVKIPPPIAPPLHQPVRR